MVKVCPAYEGPWLQSIGRRRGRKMMMVVTRRRRRWRKRRRKERERMEERNIPEEAVNAKGVKTHESSCFL